MRVTLCDVGPRDGLQNEPEPLRPAIRAELVERLAASCPPRDGEGAETGADLDALLGVSARLEGVLSRELPSRVYRAGAFPSRTAPAAASSATSASE